jgi:hypothetical protein
MKLWVHSCKGQWQYESLPPSFVNYLFLTQNMHKNVLIWDAHALIVDSIVFCPKRTTLASLHVSVKARTHVSKNTSTRKGRCRFKFPRYIMIYPHSPLGISGFGYDMGVPMLTRPYHPTTLLVKGEYIAQNLHFWYYGYTKPPLFRLQVVDTQI